MTTTISVTAHGIDGLDSAMYVMERAFDPQFGEAWTAAQCLGVMSMPGASLFVARDHNVLGFALMRTVVDEAELMLLAVLPDARRNGVGSILLQSTMSAAEKNGARHYFLEVRHDNPAIGLYEKHGLQMVGIRTNYYRGQQDVRRDALTYRKLLGEI